jgi:ribosome-binding ATPase YchF (GTP1/OBG family)
MKNELIVYSPNLGKSIWFANLTQLVIAPIANFLIYRFT